MQDFPGFMKNPKNRIRQASQYTKDVEGYVFDGADGSQLAFWTCHADRKSKAHAHPYDEYIICACGKYIVSMDGRAITLNPGDELFIPAGTEHGGEAIAGTRTIHAFGGRRAEREDA